ncbi:MAG: fused MFS/spermidine synthase [Planctomycetaceae bacterium]
MHLGGLLFLSGMCALIFQTVWFREFRLIFGGSTPAVSAVLAIFMGGLGIGNAWIGPRADRHPAPLRLYGWLEGMIALSVAVSPWLIDLTRTLYIASGGQTSLGVLGASLYRLLLSIFVLAVPTIFMGGTLPAAGKAIIAAADDNRRHLGWLYGWNTLGAVFGTLLSTFWLLEQWGTRTTLWVACGVNALIAVWSILWSWRFPVSSTFADPNCEHPAAEEQVAASIDASNAVSTRHSSTADLSTTFLMLSAACVGCAFFVMELVWYRMLGPLLGGTTYTFGIILATALVGIGVGGLIYPLWFRTRTPGVLHFAVTCLAEAVCMFVPFAWGDGLALQTAYWRDSWSSHFHEMIFSWALVTAVVVFPTAVISGIQFPILVALMGRGRSEVGRQIGRIYAANTVGAIAGSLAGGFYLLPGITAPGTWKIVVAMLALWGMFAAVIGWTREKRIGLMALCCGMFAFIGWLATFPGPSAVWRHSSIGAGRFKFTSRSENDIRSMMNQQRRRLVSEFDGRESGVGIVATNSLSFMVNGKSDGNALSDAGTQIMLSVMGSVLYPQAERALVIGLGTGESAGWLAATAPALHVDVVELEPAITQMAELCAPVNQRVLENPRVHLLFNDAREVLLTTGTPYDLVVSEPSNPYRAGVSNLFTGEFYRAVKSRLRPQGFLLQWVQGYEIDDETVGTICKTLKSVFPHVEVWLTKTRDLLFVCGEAPPKLDIDQLRQRIQVDQHLKSAMLYGWHAETAEAILSHYVAGDRSVSKMAELGTINTDERNHIEYGFARTVGMSTEFRIDRLRQIAWEIDDRYPSGIGQLKWNDVELERLLNFAMLGGDLPDSRVVLPSHAKHYSALNSMLRENYKEAWKAWPNKQEPFSLLEREFLSFVKVQLNHADARLFIEPLIHVQPNEAYSLLALWYQKQRNTVESTANFERLLESLQNNPWGEDNIISTVIDMSDSFAAADLTAAPRILEKLSRTFAVMAYEDNRKSAAVNVSALLPLTQGVDAVLAFEPYPLWSEAFLKHRLAVYTAAGHPLAETAKRELDEFLTHAGE